MIYDLRQTIDRQRFRARVDYMLTHVPVVELTEKTKRTTSQNSYLHLIIGVVAMETGNTLEYTKREYFKRLVNPGIFQIEKEDRFAGPVSILRSSADLSKEEMSLAIDRFKQWAADNGMYLPEPGDDAILREIEIEIDKRRQWL